MTSPYQELKERAWATNQEIPRRGLAIYTFGNVSALDRARLFWRRAGRVGDRVTAISRSLVKRLVRGGPGGTSD